MRKNVFLFTLLLITGIIGLLNWYATPTMSDDVLYRFVWQNPNQEQLPLERIESLYDVIKSQITHYSYINGRSITHGMAQIALNLIPDWLAKLLNTAIFLLFICLITIYCSKNKENRAFTAAITFGLLFLVISGFNTGFIWLLGSFTYLWALVITMGFLLMLRWLDQHRINWKLLPFIPLSFLMGWTHEAIALPLSVAFILYGVIHRKNFFRQAVNYCMLAYILGMLMIVTSPALWFRADIEGIPLSSRIINGCVNLFFGIRISWLVGLSLTVILIKNKNLFFQIVKRNTYLITAWIVAMGIVFSCGTSIERVPICADFLALLIGLDIWQIEGLKRYRLPAIGIVLLLSVAVAIPAIRFNFENYQNYLYHHFQLTNTTDKIIKVRQLPAHLNGFMKRIAQRYVCPTIEFSFYNCYMAFDQHDVNNQAIAQLYQKESLVFLPEDVMDHIQHDSLAYSTMESDEHQNLYIMQLRNQEEVKRVNFLLGDEVPLKFYQHIMSYQGNEYELDDFNYEVIDINQRRFLVMTIPTTNIRRRIKDISFD